MALLSEFPCAFNESSPKPKNIAPPYSEASVFFLTFFIAYFFGSSIFKKKYGDLNELELKIVDAKRRLETSKKEVEREIESFRKEETLKVKEELLNEKKIADDEIKKMKSELATKEERIAKKEETLETKMERLEDKELKKLAKDIFEKIEKENAEDVEKILNKVTVKAIETALDTIFYQREYVFYNHNLSAQGEAKIAKGKNISFYSINVTDKSDKKKAELEKYLKDMSENRNFLNTNDSKLADKFKDILKEISIEDRLHKDYEAEILEKDGNAEFKKGGGIIFSVPPKVNWTLSAEDIKNAFEQNKSLKLVYKLKAKQDVGTADITLAESTAKYKINDNRQKTEDAGKLLLKLQDVVVESNIVDTDENSANGTNGSYPNGTDLSTVEDTKPEDNNKPDNNKPDDKENNKPDNNKPDDKENNKPENNKPDNKEDNKENNKQNNKEDDKQKPENADKNKKPEINKEKGTKIPKTAIAGSSTLLLAVGILGMYISKRKNGK